MEKTSSYRQSMEQVDRATAEVLRRELNKTRRELADERAEVSKLNRLLDNARAEADLDMDNARADWLRKL